MHIPIAQALHDFKNITTLVYIILNCKGGLTGCGLHGFSLVSIPLTSQPNIAVLHFCVFQFCLFVLLFLYIIVEHWRRSGGLCKV